jgi:hypothetical protein
MSMLLSVTMTVPTQEGLLNQGSALIAFSAVAGRDDAALPLVWLVKSDFGTLTGIDSQPAYAAYTSATPIAAGCVIHPIGSIPIDEGQIVNVGVGGACTRTNGGTAGKIRFANGTTTPYTCGIQQTVDGKPAPVCAYPLYGLSTQAIAPLPRIALLFTSSLMSVGEACSADTLAASNDLSSIVLIDLSGNPEAGVNFDINRGWSWKQGTAAQIIHPSTFVSALIQPGSSPRHPSPIASRKPDETPRLGR